MSPAVRPALFESWACYLKRAQRCECALLTWRRDGNWRVCIRTNWEELREKKKKKTVFHRSRTPAPGFTVQPLSQPDTTPCLLTALYWNADELCCRQTLQLHQTADNSGEIEMPDLSGSRSESGGWRGDLTRRVEIVGSQSWPRGNGGNGTKALTSAVRGWEKTTTTV